LVVFFYGKLSKLLIWFESLLKNGAFIRCLVSIKLEIRLLFGVIIYQNLEPVGMFGCSVFTTFITIPQN
jgi:hypothetical protein